MPCPSCGSMRVRPVKPRNRWESFARNWNQTRYYSCKECGWRDALPRPAERMEGRLDLRFWVAAAVVGLGILYVLLKV